MLSETRHQLRDELRLELEQSGPTESNKHECVTDLRHKHANHH
uniref:Uncharacterized protein n=1 Tax=Arundo donax TaxID=35708 RepID=A0A0A8YKC9_ARUDO